MWIQVSEIGPFLIFVLVLNSQRLVELSNVALSTGSDSGYTEPPSYDDMSFDDVSWTFGK